jgi:hypothetical protein
MEEQIMHASTLPSQWFTADSANSGCFVERLRCDQRFTQHAKIPPGVITDISHMNNCRINEISIKFKQ